jgi:hypothetical protein
VPEVYVVDQDHVHSCCTRLAKHSFSSGLGIVAQAVSSMFLRPKSITSLSVNEDLVNVVVR